MDWSKLPDIVAVALLTSAFASVARRSYTRRSGLWLIGWLLILLHFTTFLFIPAAAERWSTAADLVGMASLVSAGILFMWAAVPYRSERSSQWMLASLITVTTLYVSALVDGASRWVLDGAACALGLAPLTVALLAVRRFHHPLRWITVSLFAGLGVFLVSVHGLPVKGPDLALNGLLFTIYLGCCIHFLYTYRSMRTGAFITTAGFFLWAMVFAAAPVLQAYFPAAHIESEVWNLPKFVVGIGMILLLLEEQIEHNKHLALHDALTELPNRRLFQDRLASALERARRTGTQAALLLIDLDHFKQVNDTLGHHVGDLLLQRVAKILAGRVRRSDTVARTGGDEFSIILESPTNGVDAMNVGRSLQVLLKEPMSLESRPVTIGASFGLAVFPDDATDMEALCIAADLRMYENKRSRAESDGAQIPHQVRPYVRSSRRRRKSGIEGIN